MDLFMTFLAASDPFADMRSSLASLLQAILGLISMVALAVVVIHIVQGDRDGAKKAGVWCIVTAVGFTLISIIGSL